MRVALVHDWLTGMRGGERVLEALLELLPQAEIFTVVHRPGSVSEAIEARPVHTSFVDRLPLGRRAYRFFLPLFPRAVESFDLEGFDLVVSSSHCVAKGVRVPPGVPHLCYCHTPMRYLWDQYDAYFGAGRASLPVRVGMGLLAPRLRRWDVRTSGGVHRFVANSTHVRERIRRCYGREAAVVHPPVDLGRFAPTEDKDDFYLVLGALVPYKRVDLAVEACTARGRRLLVVGEGSEWDRLRKRAGPSVTFTGRVPDAEVARLLARARALLLPGAEDFGIGVVEALASGTPVVALGKGGVLDTVRSLDGRGSPAEGPATGVFFDRPDVPSLLEALDRFEAAELDTDALVAAARPFSRERFLVQMRKEIDLLLERDAAEAVT